MNHHNEPAIRTGRLPALRTATLPWILWVFGLATTLLLVGLWGRAVTIDESTIARSTEVALSADMVTDRVYDLIGDGLVGATGVSSEQADAVLSVIRDTPEAEAAIGALVTDVVAALVAPPGGDTTVDVAAALAPLVPAVVDELDHRGVAVPEGDVEAAVESIDPVALEGGTTIPVGAVTEQARAVLTRGVMIAAAILFIAGMLAVAVSEDRWSMVRSLAIRIVFSALSFATLFRLGGWALDPDGGRSPLRRSGSILVESNLNVFLIAAGLAAVVAATIWVVRQPRSTSVEPGPSGPTAPPERDDTSTHELVGV
jgi:hypothetical protein